MTDVFFSFGEITHLSATELELKGIKSFSLLIFRVWPLKLRGKNGGF